ncbi:putative transferase [Nostocoides japonicum T1-X7]|uniref:Putative transferase n=1 Tax=Nostocoides japonicum T1-X7 TaxID=1194083 RepID=A0A077LTQ1_9MICO|nr:class I SAM-dependent methyltransferase [Tetrasphaera japonica]CCH76681.1 putative transferase [Tetrasphaera japonica T1-X7]
MRSDPARPPRVDERLLAALRSDLEAAAYTVDDVNDLLGPLAAAALAREQTIPAQRVTATDDSPLATLVRLLALGDPVDAADAAAALPTLGVDGARSLGLVRDEGDAVVAECDLRPHGDDTHGWWVASDLGELATRRPLRPDHVLGVGAASATLADWTVRRPVATAVDLGTGCGVQALHLSGHAREVTVTDTSRRALAYARFNAALNGQTWRVLEGDLLTPVEGERFDLVVSNPPFVITPRGADVPVFEYRDGGRAGDDVVAELVRGVGSLLRPGGVAQLLGNWEVPAGADWRDRVGEWVRGTGLDAWVVQREVQDPAQYAEVWARDGGHHNGTSEFATMYAAWLDDFASRDVEAVGFGVITLQRPTSGRSPFVDLMEAPGPVAHPMGPGVEAGLAARTLLAESSDSDLLSRRWRVADDVTEARWSRPGATDPAVIELVQGGGLRRTVRLSTAAAAYVSVADGELTADQALVAIAALLDADADSVRAEVLPVLRDAAKDGLLVL